MNIILVSGNLAKTRTVALSGRQVFFAALFAVLLLLALLEALHYAALRHAIEIKSPYLQALLASAQAQENQKNQSYLRENLSAMAARLGEMQAQLLRLDVVGERLARLAGFKPQELLFDQAPGRGGALVSEAPRELSVEELNRRLDALSREVDDRGDKLGVLDLMFTREEARRKLLPSVFPLESGLPSSGYGWRIDPFTGTNAFHEGADFIAPVGTVVRAAAGGVVAYADHHPQYGNMVEIDHGNDLVSRYAHNARLLVKVGDVVRRGGRIAEVGNTGRSTGAHLHFEVRLKGVPQDPARFLKTPG